MAKVLVVHDSATIRADLARELAGEGFGVAEADSVGSAVREIWQGSFDAALVGDHVPGMTDANLEDHLRNLAPEIVTIAIGREPAARLVRRLVDILDGAAAA